MEFEAPKSLAVGLRPRQLSWPGRGAVSGFLARWRARVAGGRGAVPAYSSGKLRVRGGMPAAAPFRDGGVAGLRGVSGLPIIHKCENRNTHGLTGDAHQHSDGTPYQDHPTIKEGPFCRIERIIGIDELTHKRAKVPLVRLTRAVLTKK